MIAVEAIRDDFIELTSFFWFLSRNRAFGRRLLRSRMANSHCRGLGGRALLARRMGEHRQDRRQRFDASALVLEAPRFIAEELCGNLGDDGVMKAA